jgi:hypothetical protein
MHEPLFGRALSLLAVAALFAAACGGGASRAASPVPAAGEGAAVMVGAPAIPLAVIPEDAEFLAVVSLAGLRDEVLWQAHGHLLLAVLGLDLGDGLTALQAGCDLDLLSTIETVVIAISAPDGATTLAARGLPRDRLDLCAKRSPLSVKHHGQVSRYQLGDDSMWVAWPTPDTLVANILAPGDQAWAERRAASEAGVSAAHELAELASRYAERPAAAFFAYTLSPGSPLEAVLAFGEDQPRFAYGWVSVDTGFDASVAFDLGSESAATAARDASKAVRSLAETMAPEHRLADRLEFGVDGSWLLLDLAAGLDHALRLVEFFGPPMRGEVTLLDRVREELAVALYEELGRVGARLAEDCDEVEAAWREMLDQREDLVAAVSSLNQDATPAQAQAFQDRYEDRLDNLAGNLMVVMLVCDGHEGIQAVLDSLSE